MLQLKIKSQEFQKMESYFRDFQVLAGLITIKQHIYPSENKRN